MQDPERLEELCVSFKFLGGHPDMLAGAKYSDKFLAEAIAVHRIQKKFDPMSTWLP